MQPVGQARRATIGYLVYNKNISDLLFLNADSESPHAWHRVKWVPDKFWAKTCMYDTFARAHTRPKDQAQRPSARATIGYLVCKAKLLWSRDMAI